MQHHAKSIRTFIGAINFEVSRSFYKCLGFEEVVISHKMCYFNIQGNLGFYLQDAYVKDWLNNSMIFLEVADVSDYWNALQQLNLEDKFPDVKLVPIQHNVWGKEFFLHDPAGVLWHFGQFNPGL